MDDSSKNRYGSSSNPSMKNKAKHLVDDLQGIFTKLRSAREENRSNDVVMFEEQLHQTLQEWKTELNKPSPASSLADGNLGLLSEEIAQLLQDLEEEDDATSRLAKSALLKTEPDLHNTDKTNHSSFQEKCSDENHQGHALEGFYQFEGHKSDSIEQCDVYQEYRQNSAMKSTEPDQFILDEDFNVFLGVDDIQQSGEDIFPNILPNICPPPSAFLGPKCALWDCFRPAQGLKCCQDYCCSSHELLATNEGLPGMTPILRPGGIGVKDGPLFAAVNAKTLGKEVGIPNCEGAASTKSPWNAPKLFDLSLFEGETVREWLYFDKPRRAFDSGNRKQRSLPDYSGRGWHESRKSVMKEYGGQKRSYYMDPQPLSYLEWHLYEYSVDKHDGYALYRLELKLVDKKKSPKGKVTKESLADIQNKMGKLSADVPLKNDRSSYLKDN
ncbi:hypothetical protein K1719_027259 [Acacia pycnantha]|nr:hypothetical protein K1719_027259 [Acacia pycnantha]